LRNPVASPRLRCARWPRVQHPFAITPAVRPAHAAATGARRCPPALPPTAAACVSAGLLRARGGRRVCGVARARLQCVCVCVCTTADAEVYVPRPRRFNLAVGYKHKHHYHKKYKKATMTAGEQCRPA
jgi:hypothetical protein